MVIDVARHLAGLVGANSREVDPTTPAPVIDLMTDQHEVDEHGWDDAPRRICGSSCCPGRRWPRRMGRRLFPSVTGTATR